MDKSKDRKKQIAEWYKICYNLQTEQTCYKVVASLTSQKKGGGEDEYI